MLSPMNLHSHEPQEFNAYDQMFALDLYNSGSSIASSSHLGSPSPQYCNVDISSDFFGGNTFLMEPADCFQTPAAVAPQDLHPPLYFQPTYMVAEQDITPMQQDMCLSFEEGLALASPATSTSEPPEVPAVPTLFPMKKDRARGKLNLQRTSNDPERQNGCTICIRKFKRRADLARHIKRHEGVRPYQCLAKSCPLSPGERFFFRADARQRHWKAHPSCEQEFYLTPQGIEWMKKNRNRSQKRRGIGRRPALNSRDTSLEASSDDFNDEDDADYHD